ncbi:MAG: hypothetical protein OHK0038_13630 [Flammeovirgaceae bacterium]
MENLVEEKIKPQKTGNVPTKQADIVTLTDTIVKKWATSPEITLVWMKAEDFAVIAQDFKNSLTQRIDAGSGRQSKTKLLQNLDKEINKMVENLKIGILNKFGKEDGKSYYSEFGIIKVNNSFKIPFDRNQRQQALATLIKGLEKHQIKVANYPLNTIKEMQTQFNALVEEAKQIDSNVSSEVSTKNELLKQIIKVINALIYVIRGNYPDTYKAELRSWGFQKEKY